MTTIPFGPQLVGRTEKALNALLMRRLAGSGVSEPQWVALTLTATGGNENLAEALRVDEAAARAHVDALIAAGLADASGTKATEDGMRLWRAVRAETAELTAKLWGDIPEADQATAARVLNTILTRALYIDEHQH
ncbi:hypothetical protein KOI35_15525 [Actinoplanes bogorensis]|uniref:MarR family transcriptional regulator n=1 Tax=Paractinoplanes bogorensis TaxID=1610840 RepID=A0ABS5YN97_9ACTN|nr:hypothetical protein [Actinoplanes bogorensis]MBU2664912.1 hypothetical protein [Actinoplanes bogorensis]